MSKSIVFVSLALFTSSNAQAGGIAGLWETQGRDAHISIQSCHADRYCGQLIWHAETDITGPLDRRNRNADLRGRLLIGVLILNAVAPRPDHPSPGSIYNPLDGRTFKAWIALSSPNELRVTGCLGPLCRSNVWRRIGN